MIKRVANRCRHGFRESQELLIVAGVARDEAFGHPVGAHRPPLVMIAVSTLSEPDLSQVFESPVDCNVCWKDVAMIIEDGLGLSEFEVQLFARSV